MPEILTSPLLAGTLAAAAPSTSFGQDALNLFFIIFLIFLNGFFVAAEFAIVKVRGTKLQALVDRGSKRAVMAQHLLENLDEYLSACQLGITIASIVLGAVGEHFMRERVVAPLLHFMPFIPERVATAIAFILGTGIIVFLHVVLGEQAPKYVAIQRAEETTLWSSYPLKWFNVVMHPFIVVLNNSATFLLNLVGIEDPQGHDVPHSEDELRMIAVESQRTGNLTRDKLDLLENIFDFSNVLVRQIMVPRTEVAVFDLRRPLADNLATAERTAHSRYPLVDGDLDQVVGVIHMKDLFWQLKDMELSPQAALEAAERRNPMIAGGDIASHPPSSGAQFLTSIAREALYVPETARINTLLREFQSKRIHMAMVVDEYGGVTGLVTFENVIEEIVGEVQDEFDQETPRVRKISDSEFMLEGIATLDEVNDDTGLKLESEEADTIGGYVLSLLGRMPKPGDKVLAPGVELMVREMRRQRIHRVTARILTEEEIEGAKQPAAEPEINTDSTEY
jgi:CBS domain containing-hemolysin-like protein